MSQSRFSPKLIVGIILAVCFGVALYLRVVLPYDQIFSGDWIKFSGVDAYYHMRLVDNLLHHFPLYITFDPYSFYPQGTNIVWPPFFDWLLASVIWMVGLGSPTQHTVDVVGVYFPTVLGALTVIPVYFIGKELFNRWVGVISAGLIAILPGEFLGRSILGFTDHHVAEVFFTTVTMLFLILAVKTARQGQLNLGHLKHREWPVVTKPLIYSLLAGISLGIYLLSWVGGLLFVLVIFVYFVIQFIIDHLRGKPTDYLGIVGTLSLLTASVISLPLLPQTWLSPLYLPSLAIAVLAPIILVGLSRLMANRGLKPAYYPLSLVGLGLAGLAIFYFVDPSLLKSMLGRFGIFTPFGAGSTILEVQPLLFPGGSFSMSDAWFNFTTGIFLSLISLGILTYLTIKRGEADKTLLLVWSLLILAATLGQVRFAYYFAVNVALLTGYSAVLIYYVIRFIIDYLGGKSTDYMSWQILEFAGLKKLIARPVELPTRAERKRAKLKKGRQVRFRLTTPYISISLWVIVIFFLVFFPNIGPAINTASQARFAPDDAWSSSLLWLRENTPEPFGEPDFYYEFYEPPPPGESYQYPESAYSVMAWWDYGHWITRIAHRIPISNPFQKGLSQAGRFFTAQDEASANRMMERLGARYVVIDLATATSKFGGVITSAGSSQEEFYDIYYQLQEGRLVSVRLFYPEYYRSLSVRLYNFDGKAVTPEHCMVVSYEEKVNREGIGYKEITSMQTFPSYEAATAYVSSQESANYKIVSDNPFISPVPLEALDHYRLIYSSDILAMAQDFGMIPSIKIFEYVK